ncbi:DNA-directed RNA polymerase subunit beta' [Candidatus Roizmanbacteria bacterium RIFCSPLOWO2_12_FULL_40_12]|uniref:DNA-directed RNA polymerase subunit beta' n=1 Tax=Candidatus Roizmanbacteria bacterium RIFCSPLOWO2_01_FULL_40_42 TaxID=1802066 RepID=A0A1F7J3H8_9BACT|nr:MAG: DNA-directed RNA polymerase subunit beta' [Candidatus Roizmanbacteria bacterium RIFCSPHIGHO2_01_FULL_40_98]OGK28936.1 MAG: DNA-directed RNA polymerase subunit beta' [Candidatus Roizmanbacteria bacterium RIFCSPHIGHO2_02_FULL_40_53]OGK29598.1 MAG: DNA-directed RNA polymerase subunit beta' [Candidatus Roizmanbacteria bacterium RIFCSPHIGHO2_12_41_18]OGK36697.1 MAG: DNA-directed RNA polymerase subunit beta' [Candidatus Roizmanbacteria bacterium RIFCSPHIGHO2_12_FULL_40_130]OGK50165.1 MAG: DNA
MDDLPIADFSGLKIRLASPDDILKWSKGEVTKPETINYRTLRPEKDGLFDERIFGPTKDYECYCGKYKRIRYKGIVCDRCGVEVTTSAVRRERMGYIKLASPIAHIWYFKGASAPLSTLLDIPPQSLERVIYYALYVVKSVDQEKQKKTMQGLEEMKKKEIKGEEDVIEKEKDEIRKNFSKEQEAMKKKLTNKEQRDLALQELSLKEKEQLKKLSNQFVEKKSQQTTFYDRIIKIVKSLKTNDLLEEDDYLYLRGLELDAFVKVGMGSEVVYEILSSLDLQKIYTETLESLVKAKGDKRNKLLKKLRIIESFMKSETSPVWMVLTILPVIPPDLRPVVQLPGGKFATSDLNDFYRRVINRNNRLKQLIELGAPEIILRNEKRMLQEAVDSLLDLQKSRGRSRTQGVASKIQKSLSDILRGKQGRFRQNLLGKRVDYSGRSTIIVGPELRIDQCGIPKEMALELFKPHLLREIILRGLAPNIKSAKTYLEQKDPIVYDILEEVTHNHPVLLNRAPTLHKLSILAFYPVLTDSHAIKLHPTVCAGYNADFDGDAMGVFLPLSKNSIDEVKDRMLPYHNLLKPADGTPIVVPNKEMALGIYYITTIDKQFINLKENELKSFSSENDAISLFQVGGVQLREPILLQVDGKLVQTTTGRVLLNQQLPEELRFMNFDVKASDVKNIIVEAIKLFNDSEKVGRLIDKLKELGFWGATISGGLSLSVFDCKIIKEKGAIVIQTEKEIEKVEKSYNQGLLTLEEKRRYSNKLWIETTENLADKTWAFLDEENPVKIIIKSGGARASREQLKQLSAMKGLVVDPVGKIIEVPTKSNYREGLSIFEYVISARGARKGLTDSALKTADAGYLTRRLVDVAHDMIVREDDCGAKAGLDIDANLERGDKFIDRIKGRWLLEDTAHDKKVIVKKGELLDEEALKKIVSARINKLTIRSALFCQSKYGVCQKCYGIDLSNNKPAEIGAPVGVIAAQSIGEPGTQLTMRVRHFGGIVISDVTQGLPRVEELFEARTPKVVSPIAEINGKVSITEDTSKEVYMIKITATDDPQQEEDFVIPVSQKLKVADGDLVARGAVLSEGYLNIYDVLAIRGLHNAQIYLLNEIQKVYESQGIAIHDKHFEVIIRKMSEKIIIEDEGDTSFIKDEVVSRIRFEEENKKILAQGGKPSVGKVSILGITKAAIYTDSWLSSASFEQTTGVLSSAAIKGQVDYLLGLKENVIIGRLIPVTAELIEKYYSKFLHKYAHNQPTDKETPEKES